MKRSLIFIAAAAPAPGQAAGQDSRDFGAGWYVLSAPGHTGSLYRKPITVLDVAPPGRGGASATRSVLC